MAVVYTAAQVAAVAARIGLLPNYYLVGITKIGTSMYLHIQTTVTGTAIDYMAKCTPDNVNGGCTWTQTSYKGKPLVDSTIAICPPTVSPIDCSL